MAGLLTADSQFRVIVSATKPVLASFSPNINLHGEANGLRELEYPLTRRLREIMGFYEGLRQYQDTKRASADVSWVMDYNGTTKALAFKEGQFLGILHLYRDGNTTEQTIRLVMQIEMATPRPIDDDGVWELPISGKMLERSVS